MDINFPGRMIFKGIRATGIGAFVTFVVHYSLCLIRLRYAARIRSEPNFIVNTVASGSK